MMEEPQEALVISLFAAGVKASLSAIFVANGTFFPPRQFIAEDAGVGGELPAVGERETRSQCLVLFAIETGQGGIIISGPPGVQVDKDVCGFHQIPDYMCKLFCGRSCC